jgi:hypothetical protein
VRGIAGTALIVGPTCSPSASATKDLRWLPSEFERPAASDRPQIAARSPTDRQIHFWHCPLVMVSFASVVAVSFVRKDAYAGG